MAGTGVVADVCRTGEVGRFGEGGVISTSAWRIVENKVFACSLRYLLDSVSPAVFK